MPSTHRTGKRSNVRFNPTEEQRRTVKAMTAYGINQNDICAILSISVPTLHKHFRVELDGSMAQANAQVAASLFEMATKGKNVTAAIFWLKCRARWQEPPREITMDPTAKPGTTVTIVTNDPVEAARAYQKMMNDPNGDG
jgi:hypothetical protein